MRLRAVAMGVGLGLLAHGLYIPAKAALAQVLLARAWEATVETGRPAKPWPWADTHAVGRLEIAGRRFVVLGGSSGEAMAFGPALSEGTASPLINGHRDTHFRVLRDVEPGDEVVWQTAKGETRYRIAGTVVVERPRARVVPGALTLTTCWPFGGVLRGPERFVVTALPVEAATS